MISYYTGTAVISSSPEELTDDDHTSLSIWQWLLRHLLSYTFFLSNSEGRHPKHSLESNYCGRPTRIMPGVVLLSDARLCACHAFMLAIQMNNAYSWLLVNRMGWVPGCIDLILLTVAQERFHTSMIDSPTT